MNNSNNFISKIETSLTLKGMSFEDVKSVVDRIENDFQNEEAESYGIIIANSEPLDHPDLDAIIDYIASKSISVSMLTRGRKLTAERIAKWAGKVEEIGIFENLKVFCEDADFDGFYPSKKDDIPAEFNALAEVARDMGIKLTIGDDTRAKLQDERKEKEQNMFYEIKALNKGIVERSAKGSIATWEDKAIKAELFPYENSEGYEIVAKTCEDGGFVTVRRDAEIASKEAEFLIEIGEYDFMATIEAESEEEAKRIFCKEYLGGNFLDIYELSIEAKTIDDMIERKADEINDVFERIGKQTLGNKSESPSRKRILYEGMKAVLSAYKAYGFLEHRLDASKMPASEFNRLLEDTVRAGGNPENVRGWKTMLKKYGSDVK